MGTSVRRLGVAMAALLLFALSNALSQANDSGPPQVWVVALDGAVGPASVDLIIRAISDADQAGAEALVIRMNTPGGLDKAMRDLVQTILASRIPVITYVSPNGARAASAGTYIAYASHIAAMAPATNIGSSTPVSIAPTSAPPQSPAPAGQSPAEPAAPSDDNAMRNKIINDAVAYLQSLAEMRGRNIEWAEETVRSGANLRASEALQRNVVDFVAPSLSALLETINGTQVSLKDSTRTLDTAGAQIHEVTTDWRHDLLSTITDPSIAYGMLIIGIYALMLEFYNPGLIIPAVTGIILIMLGAYGLQLLPINYAGLALLLLGVGLMIAEIITPTLGLLGLAGVAAFVFGSLLLFDDETPGYQLPVAIIGAFTITTAAAVFAIVGMALRASSSRIVSGVEGMIGGAAEASEQFVAHEGDYVGRVRAFGEDWQAIADHPVSPGDELRVTKVDGLCLHVAAR